MHDIFLRFLDYTNTVILIYFLAANSVYTVLMFISLYTVSLHARYAAHKGYTAVLDSPITPPVALIVPAHNEERVIVQTVLSLLALNYPEKEIIVVDDGSTESTLDRLVEQFELQRIDRIYREQLKALAPLA
ncbi:MAG TPA: glycosyltransferase family 2 protein, partial [Terriglobales bacterium]|nr:glycosyltransferase family 2 protein [Terriglobales bacterium]